MKYSGKVKTFPLVERMSVTTANAESIFSCSVGSSWKSFWDDLKFSQLVNILEFRQLHKAEQLRSLQSSLQVDEVVALLSDGNG